jgi:hypothetical protein
MKCYLSPLHYVLLMVLPQPLFSRRQASAASCVWPIRASISLAGSLGSRSKQQASIVSCRRVQKVAVTCLVAVALISGLVFLGIWGTGAMADHDHSPHSAAVFSEPRSQVSPDADGKLAAMDGPGAQDSEEKPKKNGAGLLLVYSFLAPRAGFTHKLTLLPRFVGSCIA